MDSYVDGRGPEPHRPLLDNLRDRPPRLRVQPDGTFVDVAKTSGFRRAAGVTDSSLENLGVDAKALIVQVASVVGQRNQAADFWRTLVGFWLEVEELTDGETVVVPIPSAPLPGLGVSVPMLFQVSATTLEDGSVLLEAINEPEPESLAKAMQGVRVEGNSVVDHTHRVISELQTRPDSMIPTRLQIRREDRLVMEGPHGQRLSRRNDEVRIWNLEAS